LLLLGANFAQYRVWDGIRALDYLLSRPEVDGQRVGCTGHSGGGTMTMYFCALEPRIQTAVVVEGNTEDFAGPEFDPPGAVGDAEQNLVGSLPFGIDRGDLLMAFAPKPLLICFTSQDAGTSYSPVYVKGTEEIFKQLRVVYRLTGSEGNVELFNSDLPHGYDFFTRRAAYDWFNRRLGDKALGTEEAEFDTSPPGALNCTATGEVLTSLGGRSLVQINSDRARAIAAPSPLRQASGEPQGLRQRIRRQLAELLVLPSERGPLQARVLSTRTAGGITIEEFEFWSEPLVRVPGWFCKPAEAQAPLPTIVYVSEQGKDSIMKEPRETDALVKRGHAFCTVDLRGLGNTAPRYPKAGRVIYTYDDVDVRDGCAWVSLMLGKPTMGQRVGDFLRSLDYLETRPDVDRARIQVIGVGGAGLATLLGAAMDDRPRALLLDQTLATLRSVVEAEDYSVPLEYFTFGFLRHFDLPDLAGSLVPRPCWFLNSTDPVGDGLPESVLHERFGACLEHYANNNASGKLRFLVQPDEERTRTILTWLDASL